MLVARLVAGGDALLCADAAVSNQTNRSDASAAIGEVKEPLVFCKCCEGCGVMGSYAHVLKHYQSNECPKLLARTQAGSPQAIDLGNLWLCDRNCGFAHLDKRKVIFQCRCRLQ